MHRNYQQRWLLVPTVYRTRTPRARRRATTDSPNVLHATAASCP
jgi:hypothetical protein